MIQAYVCLGSNMGDAEKHLAAARAALAAIPGATVSACSSLYRTAPQGRKDQPWFLNQVVCLECVSTMSPELLLQEMLERETALGRTRDPNDRFGPRIIDMDLLLFGDVCRSSEFLTLPHPRMTERAFVLVPLAELAPDLHLPLGDSVQGLLKKLDFRLEGSEIFQ